MFKVFAVTQPKDWILDISSFSDHIKHIVLESKVELESNVELTRHYILRHSLQKRGKVCIKSFITPKQKLT